MLPDSDPVPHTILVCGALPVFLRLLLRAADGKAGSRRIRRSRRRRICCA